MKTTNHILTIIPLGSLAVLALLVTGCTSPRTHVTEERKFIQLHHVANTGADLNLKKGDAIAMACAKCRTVLYANVNRPRTRFFTPLEHRHYCPGCKSVITTTGAGFKWNEEVKHTCSSCGSDSVFCCATTRAARPTEGMNQ
jgi:RNase P subunit RPR2